MYYGSSDSDELGTAGVICLFQFLKKVNISIQALTLLDIHSVWLWKK